MLEEKKKAQGDIKNNNDCEYTKQEAYRALNKYFTNPYFHAFNFLI